MWQKQTVKSLSPIEQWIQGLPKETPPKMVWIRSFPPEYYLNQRMRQAIGVDVGNGYQWESYVGYNRNDLKKHLESKFTDDMSWDNMDKWHIDHIVPKSSFHYFKNPYNQNFKDCWALSNLQPLWSKDNLSKGCKIIKISVIADKRYVKSS